MKEKEIIVYKTTDGKEPFLEWLFSLRDKTKRYRIEARIDRMRFGNYGDYKRFKGIIEVRFHFGKGYRFYCAEDGNVLVVLLQGGDKGTQGKDIDKALKYWRDYNEENKT